MTQKGINLFTGFEEYGRVLSSENKWIARINFCKALPLLGHFSCSLISPNPLPLPTPFPPPSANNTKTVAVCTWNDWLFTAIWEALICWWLHFGFSGKHEAGTSLRLITAENNRQLQITVPFIVHWNMTYVPLLGHIPFKYAKFSKNIIYILGARKLNAVW